MVFVFLEGYTSGAPPYTTCPDANVDCTNWLYELAIRIGYISVGSELSPQQLCSFVAHLRFLVPDARIVGQLPTKAEAESR
jgi:hypothetical protein